MSSLADMQQHLPLSLDIQSRYFAHTFICIFFRQLLTKDTLLFELDASL